MDRPSVKPANLRLFQHWRQAAGPYQNFVPSVPFAALNKNPTSSPDPTFLAHTNTLAHTLAALLVQSDNGQYVAAGHAAFVLDLPGYLTLAVGYHLQKLAIAPVCLLAAYYQPHAILNGHYNLASLQHYGPQLQPFAAEQGYAFLLERERNATVPDLSLMSYLDNRYFSGYVYFPLPAMLAANQLTALIDVRLTDDELPADLAHFYEQAALANINIFQTRLPLSDLPL